MKRLAAILLAVAACHVTPPVPPTPSDASDAHVGDCATACANLASLGCSEGKAHNCFAVMTAIDGSGASREPNAHALTCGAVAGASSVQSVRALGIVCN